MTAGMAGHAKKKNSRGPLISASQKNKQKKNHNKKKKLSKSETKQTQSALTLTATAKNTTVKGQQPDVEQWNKRTFFPTFIFGLFDSLN